jgi:hypothetical protein
MPEMSKITMGPEAEQALKKYMRNKLDWLKACHKDFHENHLPRWRKFYDAIPRERYKSFPWPMASNLVVPVVAIHTDTLHARVMAAVFRTIPLWVCQTVGEHDGIEELRQAQETFMNYVGIEPRQLDLYRVYNEFYKETIKIGTSVLKAPWTKRVESQIAASGPYTDIELQNIVVQEGPRPEKLAIEDFMVAPQTKQEDQADFISHRIRMTREDLEQRKFIGIYGESAVEMVLAHPTRTSPSTVQQQKEERQGLPKTAQGYGYEEWDIYECHFLYHVRTGGFGYAVQDAEEAAKQKATPAGFYRVIVTYHYETDTILRAVYNFYPENMHPFIAGRLILRDDAFYAKGFAEGLEMMQEEASTIHNQGLDNATMANMRFFTIRNNPKLNDSLRIYPGAMIPVSSQDDLKERQLGDIYPSNFQAQAGTMDIAERWTGISPPMQGYGAGVMQGKRGVYTALGTMSMLQEGNRRSDLAISDLRYPHILLGRKVRAMYAKWGVPASVVEAFGKLGPALQQSMTLEATKKLDILISSATASINREVERQNLLMLTNQLGTFYQQMSQVVVAMLNPQINPAQRDYITQVMECATNLENRLMKAFEYDDISRYVPKTATAVAAAQALNQPQPAPPPGAPGANPQVSAGPGGGGIPGSSPGTPAGMGGNPRQPFYQSFGRSAVPGGPSSGGPQ